jgi:hypothetical protein
MLVTSRQTEDFICAASSTLIFSRSRSVTSRRNREFSSWSSAIQSSVPRVRSGSLGPGVATNAGCLRHRCNVVNAGFGKRP